MARARILQTTLECFGESPVEVFIDRRSAGAWMLSVRGTIPEELVQLAEIGISGQELQKATMTQANGVTHFEAAIPLAGAILPPDLLLFVTHENGMCRALRCRLARPSHEASTPPARQLQNRHTEGVARRAVNRVETKKLRVCLVTPEITGVDQTGVATSTDELAKLLVRDGHTVSILYAPASLQCADLPLDTVSAYTHLGVRLYSVPETPFLLSGSTWVRRSYEVFRFLEEKAFDVVHFPDSFGLGYFSMCARRSGAALPATILCLTLQRPASRARHTNMRVPADPSDLEIEAMERFCLAYADRPISADAHVIASLETGGVQTGKIEILPRFVTGLRPRVRESKTERIDDLVFFGRLEEAKGVALFCDALDLLQARLPKMPHVTFLGMPGIVRDRPAEEYLQFRADSWKFAYTLNTHVPRHHALSYLRGGRKLAVIPSLVDGTPYTVLECLACDIPFLASNVGGIAELVEGDAGVLFPPTPEALAAKIEARLTTRPAQNRAPASNAEEQWLNFHRVVMEQHRPARKVSNDACVSICVIVSSTHLPDWIDKMNTHPGALEIIVAATANTVAPSVEASLAHSPLPATLVTMPAASAAEAWNAAAAIAEGEYLLFLLEDQQLTEGGLQSLVEGARRTGDDIVRGLIDTCVGAVPFNDEGILRRQLFLQTVLQIAPFRRDPEGALLVRKETFQALGGFSSTAYPSASFLIKASVYGRNSCVVPMPAFRSWKVSPVRKDDFAHFESVWEGYKEILPGWMDHVVAECIGAYRTAADDFEPPQPLQLSATDPDLPELFFRSSKCLFSASGKHLLEQLEPLQQLQLVHDESSAVLRTDGEAPLVALPKLDVPDASALGIYVEVNSPAQTALQLHYVNRATPELQSNGRLAIEIRPGDNRLLLRVPADDLSGFVLLSPGQARGDYRVHCLEVRALDG